MRTLCCGQREKAPTPMELQSQIFNSKQREMFAKLLVQAKARVQSESESDYSFDNRLEAELAPKLAEEYGATKLIESIRTKQKELEDAETALAELGFSCDNDSISIKYEAPKAVRKALDAAKRSTREEREKNLKKYDLAVLGVWAAETAQEAKQIVEGLL